MYSAFKGTSPAHVLSGFSGSGAASGGGTGPGSWGDSGGSASWGTDPGNTDNGGIAGGTPTQNPWNNITMDANGYPVEIPAAYQLSPGTYIPGTA